MRGRVSAVNLLFIVTSNQLGEFESGSLAALIGTTPAVVAGGLGNAAGGGACGCGGSRPCGGSTVWADPTRLTRQFLPGNPCRAA